MGTARVPVTFFENFHLESRRLEFEFKNAWGHLAGGGKKGLNFGGLGALRWGASEKGLVSSAAPAAAAIFKKRRTFEEMRTAIVGIGTFFNLFPLSSSSLPGG